MSQEIQLQETLLDIESQIKQVEREYMALGRENVTDAVFTREELQQIAYELEEKREQIMLQLQDLARHNQHQYDDRLGHDRMHAQASPRYSEDIRASAGRYGGTYTDDELELDEDLRRLQQSDGRQILEDYARMTGGLPAYGAELPSDSIETTPSMEDSLRGHGLGRDQPRGAQEEEKDDKENDGGGNAPAPAPTPTPAPAGSSEETDKLKKQLEEKENKLKEQEKAQKKLQDEIDTLKKVQAEAAKAPPPPPQTVFAGTPMGGWVKGGTVLSDQWSPERVATLMAEISELRKQLGSTLVEGQESAGSAPVAAKWDTLQGKERLLTALKQTGYVSSDGKGAGAGGGAEGDKQLWDARVTHQRWEWKGRPVIIKRITKAT